MGPPDDAGAGHGHADSARGLHGLPSVKRTWRPSFGVRRHHEAPSLFPLGVLEEAVALRYAENQHAPWDGLPPVASVNATTNGAGQSFVDPAVLTIAGRDLQKDRRRRVTDHRRGFRVGVTHGVPHGDGDDVGAGHERNGTAKEGAIAHAGGCTVDGHLGLTAVGSCPGPDRSLSRRPLSPVPSSPSRSVASR